MTNSDMATRRAAAITWAREIAADPNVVFLDTETTGLGEDAEIVDIGIVDRDGNVLLDELVRPQRPIPAEATAVHGITDAMAADADSWVAVGLRVHDALADRRVVIYNAGYDSAMIAQCCAEHGLKPIERDWQCAMLAYSDFDGTLNRRGEPKWHKLDAAAERFGIAPGGHRALADANTARLVVLAMANEPLEPVIETPLTTQPEPKRNTGMKLTIKQDMLTFAVEKARRAATTKSGQLPILAHLKLEAKDGQLRISATNIRLAISAWNDADIAEEGALTVDAKLFGDFIRNLPGSREVTISKAPDPLLTDLARLLADPRVPDAYAESVWACIREHCYQLRLVIGEVA